MFLYEGDCLKNVTVIRGVRYVTVSHYSGDKEVCDKLGDMVYILNKIHKEVALDCATVEKLVLYKITSVVFCAIDAPLQVGNILNWHR